jgi:DNA-binding response OmpR family regulator
VARILIIDDEVDLVEACTAALEHAGHAVHGVTRPGEALKTARAQRPDLVVLDWVMPGCDGGVVMTQLRAAEETAATRVLVISALADGLTRARSAGADAFLAKPFDVDQLLDKVASALTEVRASSERGDRWDPRRTS